MTGFGVARRPATAVVARFSTVPIPPPSVGSWSDSTATSQSCPGSMMRPTLLTIHRPRSVTLASQPSLT